MFYKLGSLFQIKAKKEKRNDESVPIVRFAILYGAKKGSKTYKHTLCRRISPSGW